LEGAAPSALTGHKDRKNTILPNDFIFFEKAFFKPFEDSPRSRLKIMAIKKNALS
jgi:hypothetical protein